MRQNRDSPFLLVVAPLAPHDPAVPAPRHAASFPDFEPPRPPNWREPDVSKKPAWIRFAQASAPVTPQTDALQKPQMQSLLAIDEAVAKLSDTLDEHGLTDRTLLIYLSDNGLHRDEHWWGSKFTS